MNTIEVKPGAKHFARSHGGKQIVALRAPSIQGGGEPLLQNKCSWGVLAFVLHLVNSSGLRMHTEWVWVSGCLSPIYILHLFHAHLRTFLLETGVLEMQGQPEQAQSSQLVP